MRPRGTQGSLFGGAGADERRLPAAGLRAGRGAAVQFAGAGRCGVGAAGGVGLCHAGRPQRGKYGGRPRQAVGGLQSGRAVRRLSLLHAAHLVGLWAGLEGLLPAVRSADPVGRCKQLQGPARRPGDSSSALCPQNGLARPAGKPGGRLACGAHPDGAGAQHAGRGGCAGDDGALRRGHDADRPHLSASFLPADLADAQNRGAGQAHRGEKSVFMLWGAGAVLPCLFGKQPSTGFFWPWLGRLSGGGHGSVPVD